MKKIQALLLALALIAILAGGIVLTTQPAYASNLCSSVCTGQNLCNASVFCICDGSTPPQSITCSDWCRFGGSCTF